MSYENNVCPCGGQKIPMTMLCAECNTAFKDHPSMATFNDTKANLNNRHHAAHILIALAKKRGGELKRAYSSAPPRP